MRACLSALILLFSTIVVATPLNNIVVFGDSLSDNGNLYEYMKRQLPKSPPYFQGRFTNGPVWIELLAEGYFPENTKAHLWDYAYAGAGVVDDDDEPIFTLHGEINSYLISHHGSADANSLYVLWIGSNNYLAIPDEVEASVQSVNDGIKSSLQRLIDNGARHFLILNLPDLGHIPLARDLDLEAQLSTLSLRHNAVLQSNLEELKAANPSVQWSVLNVQKELDEMLENPTQYGFTNVFGTCYEAAMDENVAKSVLHIAANVKSKPVADACNGYLFFDPVHPSALAHRILAERTRVILADAGIEIGA
jgi:phospholipase/lecithinase/hemolysin